MPQSAREVRPAQESGGDAVPVLEGLLQVLVDDLPVVLDDVGRLLAGPWPGYAEFLQQQHAAVADAGRDALRRVVDTADRALQGREIENTEEIDADLAVFVEVGRAEWRTGTSLATLLSAYRAGARVGWRCIARVAVARGIPADVVARLAEAVFVLVDHLSAASARGYVEEQQQAAAELERARADLVELLLAGRPDERLIEVTAARARWALPPSVTLVVVDPEAPVAVDLTGRLPGDCLSIRWPDVRGAIVPDAAGPGRRSRLADALRGTPAVIGPSVPPFRLAAALRIAQVAARLQREAVVVAAPLFVDEHLDAIIVHRDARLLDVLAQRVLEPLAGLPPETRLRLEETLASWLRHMGNNSAVAAELHVHRQTVRYRLGQLRELLGDALDDPTVRLRLLLVLGWQPPLTRPAGAPVAPG